MRTNHRAGGGKLVGCERSATVNICAQSSLMLSAQHGPGATHVGERISHSCSSSLQHGFARRSGELYGHSAFRLLMVFPRYSYSQGAFPKRKFSQSAKPRPSQKVEVNGSTSVFLTNLICFSPKSRVKIFVARFGRLFQDLTG